VSSDATPIVDERIVHDKRTPRNFTAPLSKVFLVRQVETAGAAVAAGALVVACFAAACFGSLGDSRPCCSFTGRP